MTGRQAFSYGFVSATLVLLGTCLCGCTPAERAGHRAEFSLARAEMDAASDATSLASDGPGPHDSSGSTSSSSDGDGWVYGLAYSIPMGDDPAAGQLRILNASVGGMRADLEDFQMSLNRLTEALNDHTEALAVADYRRARRPEPEPEPPDAPAEQPVVETAEEPVAPAPASIPAASPADAPDPAAPQDDDTTWLDELGLSAGAAAVAYGVWSFRKPLITLASSALALVRARPQEPHDG